MIRASVANKRLLNTWQLGGFWNLLDNTPVDFLDVAQTDSMLIFKF